VFGKRLTFQRFWASDLVIAPNWFPKREGGGGDGGGSAGKQPDRS